MRNININEKIINKLQEDIYIFWSTACIATTRFLHCFRYLILPEHVSHWL